MSGDSGWFAWSRGAPTASSEELQPLGASATTPSISSLLGSITSSGNSSNNNSAATGSSSSNNNSAAKGGLSAKISDSLTFSYQQRMAGFVICFGFGCLMLFLSMFYVVSIFIGRPYKFALSYSLGNLFVICSIALLVGPMKYLQNMFSKERRVSSLIYLVSLGLTIYCTLQVDNFVVVSVVIGIQVIALIWFIASYVPFAQNVLSMLCAVGRNRGSILPM